MGSLSIKKGRKIMTTYNSYAAAKIANPDCEIYCAMISDGGRKGVYGVLAEIKAISGNYLRCNPADYCSTMKEFLEACFKIVEGDKFLGLDSCAHNVGFKDVSYFANYIDGDECRYILSAAALKGGCKIPTKAKQWTIYNNTIPLGELSDDQAAQLFNAWHAGEVRQALNNSGFCDLPAKATAWFDLTAYRIKPKSERDIFIETSIQLMTSETERTMEQMFGAQFDAGARYTDNTQHFGESV